MVTKTLLYSSSSSSFSSPLPLPPPSPLHPPPACSLPLPAHAAALCAVDGGSWGAALRPAGERRDVSASPCLCALRPVVYGGGCWRAAGTGVRPGLHASRPGPAGQKVSWPWNYRVVDFLLASRCPVGNWDYWFGFRLTVFVGFDVFDTPQSGISHFLYASTVVVDTFTKLLVCFLKVFIFKHNQIIRIDYQYCDCSSHSSSVIAELIVWTKLK